MASVFDKLAKLARTPKGQQVLGQATAKAKEMAKDPKTRAKVEQGAARVRAEVAKRRGGPGGTPRSR
jgi:hypothetical protein